MELTTEEQELFTKLEQNQFALSDLSPDEQILVASTLRPSGPFSQKQRKLLYPDWWLIATDVGSLQAKLPRNIGIAARSTIPVTFTPGVGWGADANGEVLQVLSGSLLTDCREGETYGAIGTDLWGMVIAKLPVELFPTPDDIT
jgi:hypothetical protein